jgi:prevent-host-death family protein
MKTIIGNTNDSQLTDVLDSAQAEKVLITRNGRPSAIVIGVEDYDAEDLLLASSTEFWGMIQNRREGRLLPLAEVKRQLGISQSE